MQFIRRKLTGLNNTENVESAFAVVVGERFRPLVRGGHEQFVKMLNSEEDRVDVADSDVFLTQQGEVFYYRFDHSKRTLVIGGACQDGTTSEAWKILADSLRKAAPEAKWEDMPVVSAYFNLSREDSEPLRVGMWERQAANCLRSPGVRQILKVVYEKGTASLPEAAQGRSIFEVGEDVKNMADMRIINREFEIFCKETGQKISRVASLTALDEAAKRGFRCFHCGRSISDEQVVQSLSVCPQGAILSNPNVWLVYTVGAALLDCGVQPEHILFRHEDNFQSCEVFAAYKGSLLMFSISEKELDADSVFRIITRSRYFHPDYTFAVTSSTVSSEAYRVIEAENERMLIVSDIDRIKEAVESISDKACRIVLGELLRDVQEYTEINIGSIVGNYFLGAPPEVAKKEEVEVEGAQAHPAGESDVAQALGVEVEQVKPDTHVDENSEGEQPAVTGGDNGGSGEVVSAEGKQPELAGSVVDSVASGIKEQAEEQVVSAEDKSNLGVGRVSVGSDENGSESSESGVAPANLETNSQLDVENNVKEQDGTVGVATAGRGSAPVLKLEINPKKLSVEPNVEAALEPVEVGVAAVADTQGKDILPVEPFLNAPSDATVSTLAKLREHILESDDTDALEAALNELSSNGEASGMIVADDGMPFLGSMDTFADAESMAAFQPELLENINGPAEEQELGAVQRIFFACEGSSFDFYPSADGLTLSIHSQEVGSLRYAGSSVAGDNLNKALLGLTVIDSFFDAVVIWDDIVVDSTTKDCDDIALAVGKMGIAVNAYLGELSLKPWAAMVIDTESQLLAAYPLKEGAVLVCILDKSAHESVWRRDIPAKLERIQENLEL